MDLIQNFGSFEARLHLHLKCINVTVKLKVCTYVFTATLLNFDKLIWPLIISKLP